MKAEFKMIRYEYEMDASYAGEKTPSLVTIVLGYCRYKLIMLPCKIVGHKWEVHSYGNPDSGAISMECTRCGLTVHETLY